MTAAQSPPPGNRSLCLVAVDLDGIQRNGGIGTCNRLTAHLLARHGWKVHILYGGDVPDPQALADVRGRLAQAGIGFSWLGDFTLPAPYRAPDVHPCAEVQRSEQARLALEELHREHRFGLVEFAEWGGLGFRAVQARRAGLAFHDLPLVVKLHSSTQWMREGNCQWIKDENELQLDYCERYSFENADVQASPTRYMLDHARGVGWAVRPDARVTPYPLPCLPAIAPAGEVRELVFFGRLETRKGLEVFVEALAGLRADVAITFLGRAAVLGSGEPALAHIRARLGGRRVQVLTELDREQALRYLAEGDRLAVLPALSDNSPYTVLECATLGIPFLASAVGGVPEILPDEEVQQHLLFRPDARSLRRRIEEYLAATQEERAGWRERARQAVNPEARDGRVLADYEAILAAQEGSAKPLAAGSAGDRPLVSVVVPYHNLPEFLPETLESLAAQTWPELDVIVIDDGSTDAGAVRVFDQQRARFPQFRFLHQPNAGIGATRNRGLRAARGEYVVCVDADNIAHPRMIERFVAGMQRRPDCSALSCYYLAFRDGAGLARGEHEYAYRPTGGPYVLASLRNVYGDANSIYRRADFLAVGGFEEDRDTSFEDWEAFVKLARAGYRVDVLPEHLFYYRHRDEGFSRATNAYRNRQRVLRQFPGGDRLPLAERIAIWTAVAGLQHGREHLKAELRSLRYRVADRVHRLLARAPLVQRLVRSLLGAARSKA